MLAVKNQEIIGLVSAWLIGIYQPKFIFNVQPINNIWCTTTQQAEYSRKMSWMKENRP